MNRKQLLALAKSKGYQGGDDLKAVKTFLTENMIELVDATGKALDIDGIWTKTVKITVTAEGEDVSLNGTALQPDNSGGAPADAPAPDAPPEKSARQVLDDSRAAFKRATAGIATPAVHAGPAQYERKQYERKIKDGRAVFTDPDQAEFFGAYMRLVTAKQAKIEGYSRKSRDLEIAGKAFASSVNTLGGALVPEEIANVIIDDAEKYGAARKLANVVQMSRDTYTGPRWTTDLTMSHLAENGSITAADPGTDSVTLTAKKVGCLALLSNEVLEDSAFSVGDLYAKSGSRAIAYREDLDYIRGDGTSTYGGHVGLFGAITSVAQGTSNTWATQVGADFDNMIGRIENFNNSSDLAFLCSRQYYWQVMRRLDNATSQFRELSGQGQEIEMGMFKGWPVIFSPVMPTATATTGITCFFGCFKAASMLGIRKELSVATSSDYAFNADQLAIRMISRIAVNIHGDGRASTYGPVTALKTG